MTSSDRYINLFTDYGFKKIFGEEPNKELLIAFLNELLKEEGRIEDLSYIKNERLGKNEEERKAIYDLYCTNNQGEKFIVEIQRVNQKFFKDRSIYYSSFAIQDQAIKGREWRYELKGVYTIAILDFSFEHSNLAKLEHRVKLMDILDKKIFYDKLTFIYLEIPKFWKTLKELSNDYERWLFVFKNLHRLQEMPKELEEGVFRKLFELAEIANMDNQSRMMYQESLKDYWDLKSSMETYYEEGFKEGKVKGEAKGLAKGIIEGERKNALETAKKMKVKGYSIDEIATITGLSEEEVEHLH